MMPLKDEPAANRRARADAGPRRMSRPCTLANPHNGIPPKPPGREVFSCLLATRDLQTRFII
jgi:hypothetical protein